MIIHKAGGIIVRTTERGVELLLIHRGRYDDWSVPKGHVEPNESLSDAGLREVLEETGLRCRVIRELPSFEYVLPTGEQSVVSFFEMQVIGEDRAQKDEEADELRWCTLKECSSLISYSTLLKYLQSIYA